MNSSHPVQSNAYRGKRSWKNLLLDRSFQLKYTGYIVSVGLVSSIFLGTLLLWQMQKTVRLANEAVTIGARASEAGTEAVKQSDSLNKRLEMDAQDQYPGNPILKESIESETKKVSDKLQAQARELAAIQQSLVQKRDALTQQRAILAMTLSLGLALFLAALAMAGIVITHRVAGPVFKMKRLLRDVGEGRLVVPGRLRRGDELVEFFDVFATMVERLRSRQEAEIALLGRAIEKAEARDADAALEALQELRRHMQSELEQR